MFAKIAVIGIAVNAQTEMLGASTVPGTGTTVTGIGSPVTGTGSTVTGTGSTVTGTGSPVTGTGSTVAGTGSTVTGTGSTVTGTGSTVTGTGSTVTGTGSTASEGFDPTKNLINIHVGNCSIAALSSLDTMNLFEGVKDFINGACLISSTVSAVREMEGVCHVKMIVTEASAYDELMQCLRTPVEMTYLETTYPVSISAVPMSPIVFSPMTVGDVRDRLEAGLVSDLMNDAIVVRLKTAMPYISITDSVDDALTYFNEMIVKIEGILNKEDSSNSKALEVLAIERADDGMSTLVVRPVAADLEGETATLQALKDQMANPMSELNVMMGSSTTSTMAPNTTDTVFVNNTTLGEVTDENKSDAALIGGLIGGIAGVAAIGGGIAVWRSDSKKKTRQEATGSGLSPVMTPNTTHGVNGILTERTPRRGAE